MAIKITAEQHAFSVSLAKTVGLNQALILGHFYFWYKQNRVDENNFNEGRCWTYQTYANLCDIYPYLTKDKICYAIERLIEGGLLLKSNFNKNKLDRTNWYALTDEGLSLFDDGFSASNSEKDVSISDFTKCITDNRNTDSRNISILNSNIYNKEKEIKEKEVEKTDMPIKHRINGISDTLVQNDTTPPMGRNAKKAGYTHQETPLWIDSFEEYQKIVQRGYEDVISDRNWIRQQEELNPRLDVMLSIRKSYANYWSTEQGWYKKIDAYTESRKKRREPRLNWKTTFANTLSYNAVYKPLSYGQAIVSQERQRYDV